MMGPEVHGELLTEKAVEVLARVPYFLCTRDKNFVLIAGVGKDAFQIRHLIGIELRPHDITHEK